ncbi:MAG: methionine--tRNA ligase [Candidatus Micrarchaeia archaeon]
MEGNKLARKKILITSALPYVNNVPHLGNIIGCVLSADVFARYCRSRGYETLYICGTDEYGTATETKALEEGVTPKELCDKYYAIHKRIYEWFGISTDTFGRTTTPIHTEITQEIFLDLHKNGYVVEDDIVQAYDEKAQMFLADRYIEGTCPHCGYASARADQCDKCGKLLNFDELINPISKVSKTTPVKRSSRHLFIDLPNIQTELDAWIDKTAKEGSWSENSYKIAKAWIAEGLKKRCITRDLKWGVPVPLAGWENKVFYVWFDAPIGYISITANLVKNWRDWWQNPDEVALYQFMGKDNVPFHTVIFPSTLMGAQAKSDKKWTLLHHISTTEFLNYEGGKFSKSKGLGVFGTDAMDSGIPADVWRYYLLTNRPEKMDTNFTWQDFGEKSNNELLANIGNLVNRTLVFTAREFAGKVPPASLSQPDNDFISSQQAKFSQATELLEQVQLKEALHVIMQAGKEANAYFQKNEPWKTAKDNREKCASSIYVLLNQVKDFAIALEPFVPHTSAAIFRQLAVEPKKWDDLGELSLTAGHPLGKPEILFRKIEAKELEGFAGKYGGTQAERDEKSAKSAQGEAAKQANASAQAKAAQQKKEKPKPAPVPPISETEIDFEVGKILEIARHPNAEKLYVEKIQLAGGEVRQVVSGLVPFFTETELLGKTIILVKNLKPAVLRGTESQGMLLAAENAEGKLEVLSPVAEVGTKATIEGAASEGKPPAAEITIDQFFTVKLEVKGGTLLANGKPVLVGGKQVKTEKVLDGKVR